MVFPVFLTGQAHALLQSRLHGNTMAVDAEQRELLETYAEVVNFLRGTYATDKFISEAVGDVTSFRQSSNMTEEVYSNQLWDKLLRCGTVFSDRRLKSLFVEGILPAKCAQVRNYLATHPRRGLPSGSTLLASDQRDSPLGSKTGELVRVVSRTVRFGKKIYAQRADKTRAVGRVLI